MNVNINGRDYPVPQPLLGDGLEPGDPYWYVQRVDTIPMDAGPLKKLLGSESCCVFSRYGDDSNTAEYEDALFDAGLCFKTQEEAQQFIDILDAIHGCVK